MGDVEKLDINEIRKNRILNQAKTLADNLFDSILELKEDDDASYLIWHYTLSLSASKMLFGFETDKQKQDELEQLVSNIVTTITNHKKKKEGEKNGI